MKVYVAAPGQHNWPSIPDHIQDRLLEILSGYVSKENLIKYPINYKRRGKINNSCFFVDKNYGSFTTKIKRCNFDYVFVITSKLSSTNLCIFFF